MKFQIQMSNVAKVLLAFGIFYSSLGIETAAAADRSEVVRSATDFPFVVSIRLGPDFEHTCGGFIYSDWFVVTSAQCVSKNSTAVDPKTVKVVAGKLNLSNKEKTEQTREISQIIIEENFVQNEDGSTVNDLAMLRLYPKFEFNPAVNRIPIATDDSEDVTGMGTTIGWSKTSLQGSESGPNLRKSYVSVDECRGKEYDGKPVICAQGNGVSDLGGPLLCGDQDKVICGLFSYQTNESPDRMCVFTKISNFSLFIFQTNADY